MSDDFTHDTSTTGSVAVGGTATGEIEARNDIDWFAVELVAGRHYVIDLEGADSGGGTLDSTVLRGLYDADGNHIVGSHSNFGGDGEDARLTFTATESGKYFIAARGSAGATTGTYTVRVTETQVSDGERAGAKDLGDITDLGGPRYPNTVLDGDGDTADYFKFTLSEAKLVELGLRQQDANADLFLEDAQGTVLASSTEAGTANELIAQTLLAGTYYIRVEAQEAGANQFKLRYGVSDADAAAVAALEAERQTEQQASVNQAPAFGAPSYEFDLAEIADGSVTAVALGAVSATDPQNDTVTYSIEDGNDDALFEIDESTGALTYKGTGEDYESETTSYELTVRASDGTNTTDVTVTVNVTDVEEAPTFGAPSYEFDLAELADGSGTAVALGTVSATDPQGDTVTYSITDGNDDALFEIDRATGALTYKGTGEDYESETTSYELTVRASDGTNTTDVTVTVNVTDVEEAPTFGAPSYEFDLAELADGSGTAVALGTVSATDPQGDTVTYSITDGNDDALFEIDRATGALTYKGTGEDYESETTSYELTVRASDGTNTTDVTVTVNVTDVEEAPRFGQPSYEFDLAEIADGSSIAVALGTVSATDLQNDTLTYSIEDGNDDGLFEIDESTGALSYQGTGEDYESETKSYSLTVRASDGTHTTDVAVTVRVTDVEEAPAFGAPSYAFDLAELADGSSIAVALGAVSATDPQGDTVTYSIAAGNDDALFEIDRATGALSYKGTGEDYESGTTSYPLTVRASDGTNTTDVAVTIRVTDVPGDGDASVSQEQQSTPQTVSEPSGEDLPTDTTTTGWVAVGGTATGNIGTSGDQDWFAVEFVAGRTYQIDLRGSPTEDGTLSDPYLRGIYDSGGTYIAWTRDDDDGHGRNSQVTFAATETGTHYIAAGAFGNRTGTYELEVADSSPPGTANQAPTFGKPSYAFDLAENAAGNTVPVALGTVTASDPENGNITYTIADTTSITYGTSTLRIDNVHDSGLFEIDESTGALSYKGTGEDYESGTTHYWVYVQASDGTMATVVTVTVNVTDVPEAPTFGLPSYTFDLAENVAGDTVPVALGAVSASDPQDDTLTYSIESGNDAGLFEIDESTGALSYKGSGEDYESVTTSYPLTVQASDGEHTTDVAVTVNVTDVLDTPTFGQTSYAFDLAENANGSSTRVALGTVSATDPQNDTLTYSIVSGNDTDLFEIDESTGALSYKGTGEDYESVTTSYPLTVRASDGTNTADVTVTVSVTGVPEAPIFRETSYAFDLAEKADGSTTRVALGTVSASDPEGATLTYSIENGNDDGLFEIDVSTGALTYKGTGEDYESGTTSYPLTVRASDGTHATDMAVTVKVTDVPVRVNVPDTSVSEPDGEDLPGATTTTGRVAVGGIATGNIGRAADLDWFAVELVAGRTYTIDLRGLPTNDGTLTDPYLRGIYDSDGNLISGTRNDDFAGSRNSRVVFTAPETDTHYIAAGAFGTRQGTYELEVTEEQVSVSEPDGEDLPGDTTTTGWVALVATGTGTVSGTATGDIGTSGDRDWFAVQLEAGWTYRIDLFGIDSDKGTLRSPYLRGIHNADGNLIPDTTDFGSGKGNESRLRFAATETGTYYIAASGLGQGTYEVGVEGFPPDDFSDDTDTTGRLEVGGSATGEIGHRTDRDWFAVELEAGKTYQIDVGGVLTGGGTVPFGRLYQVYDSTGSYTGVDVRDEVRILPTYTIATGTYPGGNVFEIFSGEDDQAFFTPDEDGTYYVAVGYRVSDSHRIPGTYTVRVSEIEDDFAATVDTTGTVEVGGTATGEIEYEGDRDWFAVELTAGETYKIELLGGHSTWDDQDLRSPYIRGIHDSTGDLISDTTDSSSGPYSNSEVLFTPDVDGTYYVAAGNSVSGIRDEDVGTYTLQVSIDDFRDDTDTTGTVAVGGSVTGEIEAQGDRDWFAVTLEAGKTYQIDMEGSPTDAGTLANPLLLSMHDADGNEVRSSDGGWLYTGDGDSGEGLNARSTFTADESGTYYVHAGSGGFRDADDSHGRSLGTYTLSVEELVDAI